LGALREGISGNHFENNIEKLSHCQRPQMHRKHLQKLLSILTVVVYPKA
jgi:hypothetical protein